MEACGRPWEINDLMVFNWTSGFSTGRGRGRGRWRPGPRWFIRKRDGVDRDVIGYLNPRAREKRCSCFGVKWRFFLMTGETIIESAARLNVNHSLSLCYPPLILFSSCNMSGSRKAIRAGILFTGVTDYCTRIFRRKVIVGNSESNGYVSCVWMKLNHRFLGNF